MWVSETGWEAVTRCEFGIWERGGGRSASDHFALFPCSVLGSGVCGVCLVWPGWCVVCR